MTSASTSVAAAAATGLVVATFAHAVIEAGTEPAPPSPREVPYAREAEAAALERCALYHARFGGRQQGGTVTQRTNALRAERL